MSHSSAAGDAGLAPKSAGSAGRADWESFDGMEHSLQNGLPITGQFAAAAGASPGAAPGRAGFFSFSQAIARGIPSTIIDS